MSEKKENPSKETATDQRPGTSRRAALKKMAVGTGVAAGAAALPDKWAKPLVDKVLVPTHAQTSSPEVTTTPALTTPAPEPRTIIYQGFGLTTSPNDTSTEGITIRITIDNYVGPSAKMSPTAYLDYHREFARDKKYTGEITSSYQQFMNCEDFDHHYFRLVSYDDNTAVVDLQLEDQAVPIYATFNVPVNDSPTDVPDC